MKQAMRKAQQDWQHFFLLAQLQQQHWQHFFSPSRLQQQHF